MKSKRSLGIEGRIRKKARAEKRKAKAELRKHRKLMKRGVEDEI